MIQGKGVVGQRIAIVVIAHADPVAASVDLVGTVAAAQVECTPAAAVTKGDLTWAVVRQRAARGAILALVAIEVGRLRLHVPAAFKMRTQ